MSDDVITIEHIHEPERFQIAVNGEVAGFTQFVDDGGKRIFFHTSIHEAFGGRGLAGQLVTEALDQTRAAGLPVVALCPYVKGFIEKHEEYADLAVAATPQAIAAAQAQTQL